MATDPKPVRLHETILPIDKSNLVWAIEERRSVPGRGRTFGGYTAARLSALWHGESGDRRIWLLSFDLPREIVLEKATGQRSEHRCYPLAGNPAKCLGQRVLLFAGPPQSDRFHFPPIKR